VTTTQPHPTVPGAGVPLRGGGPVAPSNGVLRPLGPTEVALTTGFWADWQQLNSRVIIGHCLTWMERIGWLGNFDRAAAGELADSHAGIEFVDSEVYKLLEAMAWDLGRSEDPELAETYARVVARVGAAQEADGYLHTSFGRPGQRARYSDLEWGHELYCFGHLIQAAVARLRSGHDDELPAIARRLADHLWREFGPEGREAVCGHPEIEPALAELGRATGDARYLELARLFVARRGRGLLGEIEYGPEYFQDDLPVREAEVLRGHAVRALYLAAGAYDVAVESDDAELAAAIRRQWEATVARRTYLTGGMGAHHRDEAFGADFELPPDRAYSETCAGIASVMLSWRLLLDTGDERYADLVERTLLNNVLVSPRADGRAFYYTNTLHQRTLGVPAPEDEVSVRALSSLRAPWFEVSCCPTNVARMLASAPLYFATATDRGVQLHQYGGYRVRTELAGGEVELEVSTGYPHDGTIRVVFLADTPDDFELSLRIPAWARGAARVTVDGESSTPTGSTWVARRGFCRGDQVVLELPLTPRFTYPAPSVDAVRGQVAVERGPLVLVLESVDLPPGVEFDTVVLDTAVAPVASGEGAVVRARAAVPVGGDWPYGDRPVTEGSGAFEARLVPYATWANRGPSTMRVFTPIAQ
jgi:DUF1680 family protein